MTVKAGVTIKKVDKRWQALRKHVIELAAKKAYVKVGVLQDKPHEGSDLGVLEIACVHEFGSPAAHIPERSFIRSTFHTQEEGLRKVTARAAKAAFDGKIGLGQALGLIGAWGVAAMQRTIRTHATVGPEEQANKPATIAAKGSSTPLIDTGALMQSLSWQVVGAEAYDGEPFTGTPEGEHHDDDSGEPSGDADGGEESE